MQFPAHLHTHSVYTKNNATLTLDQLVNKTVEYGQSATALVDSGSIAGFGEFTALCRKSGIQPIYGCGFYHRTNLTDHTVTTTNHLVLLAKDETGFENLCALAEAAEKYNMIDGKPHIDDLQLSAFRHGLICLTGGAGGEINKLLKADDWATAEQRAIFYHKLYGRDFYLELQDHGQVTDAPTNEKLVKLGKNLNIQRVVSQGAFYAEPSDAEACNQLRAEYGNKTLNGSDYDYKSPDAMAERFKAYPDALANIQVILDQIDPDLYQLV